MIEPHMKGWRRQVLFGFDRNTRIANKTIQYKEAKDAAGKACRLVYEEELERLKGMRLNESRHPDGVGHGPVHTTT